MKKYRYEAIDRDGKQTDGIFKAADFERVVTHILSRGMYPTYIEELTGSKLVAHERLSKMKEIRDRLENREDVNPAPPLPLPVPLTNRGRHPTLLLLAIFLAWLAMVAIYLSYNN